MKTLYSLIFSFLAFSISLQAQIVWENFEDVRKPTYDFENGTFIPYFENPDQSGANTSLIAAQYTRNPAELFDVIVMDAAMADLSDYVSGSKSISLDVWSPAVGKTVQITLENSNTALPANFPTGRHSVYLATTSVANAWETLTFSFDNQPDPSVNNDSVNRLVLLFDPNTNNNDTYYWDNLNGPELDNDPCSGVNTDLTVLNDFECQQNIRFTFSHAGVNFRRIENPDASGANTSSFVASYIRNAAEENDVIVGSLSSAVSVNANYEVKLDVWESVGGKPVRVSLQDGAGNVIEDLDATTSTTTSAWQTLTFPVSSSGSVERVVVLFDPGNFTSDQYYFDNLTLDQASSISNEKLPIDISVYPNPSMDKFNFEFVLENKSDLSIRIIDINGKTVDQVNASGLNPGKNTISIDNSVLNSGIYFYQLETDKFLNTGKLIKK